MTIVADTDNNKLDEHLQLMQNKLLAAKIDVTDVYEATMDTDPGLEINGKFVLQYSSYCNPRYHLDKVESPGEEIFESNNLDNIISFLLEHA